MTNTELTLEQLQAISGGAAFMKLGDIRGEYRQVNGKAGVECKVPPSFKKPQDGYAVVRERESLIGIA